MENYGPRTEEIKRMLETASNMSSTQESILSDMEKAIEPAAWANAYICAMDSIQKGSYLYACWCDALSSLHDVMKYSIAWVCARDSLLAIMTKDNISEEHFNTLYGPWKSVMGK